MEIQYSCPQCDSTIRASLNESTSVLACSTCTSEIEVPAGALSGGHPCRCLVCPSRDLFVRKAFPQRLGVAIVVAGFGASCVSWYFYWTYLTFAILFATALVDVILYAIVGEVVSCYRCGAIYRGLDEFEQYGRFDLETHERYRQEAARLSQ